MAEIFKEAQAFNNNPGRWNHDLSKKDYVTMKAGIIYPGLFQFMCPSDSAKLDIAALLQFMPTPTPLQSNVRVIFHVFFQRMKNIVAEWGNWLEQLPTESGETEAPYILPSVQEFVPGSIHDYVGVPVCVVKHGDYDLPMRYYFGYSVGSSEGQFVSFKPDGSIFEVNPFGTNYQSSASQGYGIGLFDSGSRISPAYLKSFYGTDTIKFRLTYPFSTDGDTSLLPIVPKLRICLTSEYGPWRSDTSQDYRMINCDRVTNWGEDDYTLYFNSHQVYSAIEDLGFDGSQYIHFDLVWYWVGQSGAIRLDANHVNLIVNRHAFSILSGTPSSTFFINGSYSYADFPHLCPYVTIEDPLNTEKIRLRAYRYRVYESVYNAFYRNVHGNQPFMIDGVPQYNKYNTTRALGVDRTNYHLFNRNWELDAYTSCLPSPQQGNPPLVGVTSTGRLRIQDDDGTVSTAQLQDLPDGQQGLAISQINAQSDQHRQMILNLASSGISINDLREANALTKFLETNIRKGFRYIDFILGHFGKAPKHAEMDMPEFVGGFTVKLDVGKVTNTNAAASATNENDVLGQFAGSAQAFGSSKHSIQYYADDYGYLMVTMCIVPDSSYSQVLPKDFLYSHPLDIPFPEFSHLSYQPITYEEFCPGECWKDMVAEGASGNKHLSDVFGYQRPQHELVWNPDTLHGQFLTTMNNYVISRFFDGRPELGNDFLTIKPEEVQNVFTVVKADNDIAFGQVAYHLIMKRPFPRIVIPSIGR